MGTGLRLLAGRVFSVFGLILLMTGCFEQAEEKDKVSIAKSSERANNENNSWLATIQSRLAAGEYRISLQDNKFHAVNRQQNLRFYFYEGGQFTLQAREGAGEPVELKTVAVRQGDSLISLNGGAFVAGRCMDETRLGGDGACLARLERRTGVVTEWFDNRKEGLEQGFDLAQPISENGGLIVVEVSVANAEVKSQGSGAVFMQGEKMVAQVHSVFVLDARGTKREGRVEVSGSKLLFTVDPSGLVYPLTIDPLYDGTPDRVVESNQADAKFGVSVASAGDVNGDGYSDIIVGAPYYNNGQTDEGAVFIYHGSASGIGTTYARMLESNQANAYFGYSVSSAGDVNGDGYSDIIVGANYYTNGETYEGAVFIYHGSASGIGTTYARMLESNQAGAYFGYSVSSAGDVNGDGYGDVIVGATDYDNGQTDEGAVFIYHGSASGIGTTYARMLELNQANAQFGWSVASGGDVNGDGYSDIIVGVPYYNNGQSEEGAVFIYHGSASGIGTTYARMLESNQVNAHFGRNIASAGDVNGDGYSDIIVGAPFYANGETNEGAVFIYHGSASGIGTTYARMLESNQVNAYFGYSVSSAGDVNGDGYGDVIVGATGYDNGQSEEGAVFIYHGSASGIGTTYARMLESNQVNANFGCSVASGGDVNGDGYSDIIVGAYFYDNGETNEGGVFIYHGSASGTGTAYARMLESNQAGAQFGYSVASGGDVNGDGYGDIIIGAPFYDNGETDEGAVFIYHGSASGIGPSYTRMLESNQAGAQFGYSVASGGDVNGDGYGDIIIGAPFYDKGQTDEGAVFIYHGSASGIGPSYTRILESNQAGALFGWSVASGGDVNGDGYSDIIIGARSYDNGENDEGAAFIYHGSASGIGTTYARMLESNQANAYFGTSVASAGDVNGDGYSDIIVGAPYYDNGESEEGAAFIYHGSASGIGTTAARRLESNQANAYFGNSVASAGDVNGDGYSDIIVGARFYNNGQAGEGAAFIYHGSASGIGTNYVRMLESNQANAEFGYSVASAGDVNGDGYSDVIVGAHFYNNGEFREGAAFIYHGSASGIGAGYANMLESNQVEAFWGRSVASAGDVNGDGYSDVIVGAPFYDNPDSAEGAAFIYLGNVGGKPMRGRQFNSSGAQVLSPFASVPLSSGFSVSALARSFMGRSKAQLWLEYKGHTQAFNNTSLIKDTNWYDTGTQGNLISKEIGFLSQGNYKWRLRFKFADGSFSRWFVFDQSRGVLTPDIRARANYGTSCTTGAQCGGGNCVDGVCCNEGCGYSDDSDCQVCSIAKGATTNGICKILDSSKVCRLAAGVCDAVEYCTGNSADCPADLKLTSVCRNANGDCDVAEVCDGINNDCPSDAVRPDTYICRVSKGECDVEEKCNGTNKDCPEDAFKPDTTVCRTAKGFCDAEEYCTGSSPACPEDLKLTIECRKAEGDCDLAEICDGINNDCPGDAVRPDTYICRVSKGECDVEEKCDGSSKTCPPDLFKPETTVCRTAKGVCDTAEYCTGLSWLCPENKYTEDGELCDDSNPLTKGDKCIDGECTGNLIDGVCGNEIEIENLPYSRDSTLTGRIDTVDAKGENCTSMGADEVYKVNMEAGKRYRIEVISKSGSYVGFNIMKECGLGDCLAGADNTGGGEKAEVVYEAVDSGEVYIVVEGEKEYSIRVSVVEDPDAGYDTTGDVSVSDAEDVSVTDAGADAVTDTGSKDVGAQDTGVRDISISVDTGTNNVGTAESSGCSCSLAE